MQYDNRKAASSARAVIRCAYSVLCILIVLAFLGDFGMLGSVRWALLGLLAFIFAVTHIGGLSKIVVQANEEYVELKSSPLLSMKGHTSTYSVFPKRLVSHSHRYIMGLHYLSFKYIGHAGYLKQGHVGLTLMENKERKKLLKLLKKITDNNANTAPVAEGRHD